jgi:hypothetical protein
MPYKDKETQKRAQREWHRKRSLDPAFLAKESSRKLKERDKWTPERRAQYIDYMQGYMKRQRASSPLMRMADRIRGATYVVLKKARDSKKAGLLGVGCTAAKLREHIESQFLPGMTWENFGSEWEIDHKIPLTYAATVEELIELAHYTNIQPLWGRDNLSKIDRLPSGELARKRRKRVQEEQMRS